MCTALLLASALLQDLYDLVSNTHRFRGQIDVEILNFLGERMQRKSFYYSRVYCEEIVVVRFNRNEKMSSRIEVTM